MSEHDELLERIDRLSTQARASWLEPQAAREMNDVLSEGYARALEQEARLDQLEERLANLLSEFSPGRASELRQIAAESRATQHEAGRLRRRLAILHERYITLAAGAGRC